MVNREEILHLMMENSEILYTLLHSDAATLDKIADSFEGGSEGHNEVAIQTRDVARRRRSLAKKIKKYVDRSRAESPSGTEIGEPFCSVFFEGEYVNGTWRFY